MGNDQGGYSLGKRTTEPHHEDGWEAKRESKEEPAKGEAPPRGTLRSGTHDQSEAHE
jgi:hypothetical protein